MTTIAIASDSCPCYAPDYVRYRQNDAKHSDTREQGKTLSVLAILFLLEAIQRMH